MAELLYFTFGSNMLSSQMQARCPGASFHSTVRVDGYDVVVNLATASRERNSLEGFHVTETGMT